MDIPRPVSAQPIPERATKIFGGKLFDVYQWEQVLYDGNTATFEKLQRPDTVVVYPILPDGTILLTKQEQPGKEPFISSAGGRVDPGEDILDAAKRELLEETGYEAEEWILWDAQQPVSKVEWAIYTFIAKGLKKVTEPNLDGGEKIDLMPVTFDEFVKIASDIDFVERETVLKVLAARLDPEKFGEFRKTFSL